ncbi:uncharacterized protein LOC133199197 [Saccostrea echinata]|uniref:uncharacterized protein LOC133199197 n=1 Tax=Saccostrea echinata TaxID=191078 RepID=UPI002A806DD1|nr:uncharacterized protein LOC133199197 [Saccostrea echinata]
MSTTRKQKPSTNYWCVVPECTSDSRKRKFIGKYPWMDGIVFIPFPTKKKNPKLRQKGVEMIRRPLDYDPLPHHRVCSRHFIDGHNVPELFPWNNYKVFTPRRSTASITKREADLTVNPSSSMPIFEHNEEISELPTLIEDTLSEEVTKCDSTLFIDDGAGSRVLPVASCINVTTSRSYSEGNTDLPSHQQLLEHSYSVASTSTMKSMGCDSLFTDTGIQTDMSLTSINDILSENEELKKIIDDKDTLLRDIFLEKVTKSDDSIRKFTGLPSLQIFNTIKDAVVNFDINIKYWTGSESETEKRYQNQGKKPGPIRKLSRSDEFILTSVRLRLALPVFVMSQLFGVSCSRVSSIFTTWMFCLYHNFKDCIIWPSRDIVKKFMPKSFRQSYPRTRAIIDCSEIFIQRPKNPTVNARTYSTYKSHNTFKFLVSITPNGAFNFISEIWGGNSSDRYITEHSGFLDLLSAGDEIMADRGFTIRDLLTERKAYLTIPPFTRKCNWGKGKYLCASDIKKTRKIANLRIHVERAIGRLKTFKLISQTIPWDMKSLVHPMVTVAAFFCNLH